MSLVELYIIRIIASVRETLKVQSTQIKRIKFKKMSGKIEKTTLGTEKHEGDVSSCVYSRNTVYSGGADGKIKVCIE